MSGVDILFMVLVVGVAILMAILKDRVPSWLGFVLMLAAAIAAIVGGAATKHYKVVPLGVAGMLSTILVWITGATSRPSTNYDPDEDRDRGRDSADTLGGIATRVKWWAWLIAAGLVLGGVAVGFALPA
jgi:hypothetical protein